MTQMTKALWDVTQERDRQISVEGWTPEHDDKHQNGEIADAAACYAATTRVFMMKQLVGRAYEMFPAFVDLWPWSSEWWKPKTRRQDLVRAGALILAEIERLDRKEARG